jgi:hypothetical protein
MGRCRTLAVAVCLSLPLSARAVPVEFAPLGLLVLAPPYPTEPLVADVRVPVPGASALLVDQLSVRLDSAIPAGAIDWAQDTFSFGVEREMKESGEKGGTEDINIGVGELQESAFHVTSTFPLVSPMVSGASLTFETVSPLGRVVYTSVFTTAQPAAFESLSVAPGADGRSFDLRFRLRFSGVYDPDLAIANERLTGDFTPVPEPAPWLLGLVGLGLLRWRRPF